MQGVCLFPLTLEKQNALRMVIEDLVVDSGFARNLQIVQVRCHSLIKRKTLHHLHLAFKSAVFTCQWDRFLGFGFQPLRRCIFIFTGPRVTCPHVTCSNRLALQSNTQHLECNRVQEPQKAHMQVLTQAVWSRLTTCLLS